MNSCDPFNLRPSSALSVFNSSTFLAVNSAGKHSRQNFEEGSAGPGLGSRPPGESAEGMSFTLPNNVPAFNNPQRRFEDGRWGSSGRVHGQRNADTVNSMGDKIGGLLDKRQLPMYKDKPYNYATSSKQSYLMRRKRVLAGVLVIFLGLLYWLGIFSKSSPVSAEGGKKAWSWLKKQPSGVAIDWLERRERVKEAFMLSWDGYEKHAWGTSASRALHECHTNPLTIVIAELV